MAQSEPQGAARVLVVDDDRDILRVVRMAFEVEAFEVAAAGSAAEALDWIARHGLPDLGVFDMNMPGMSGLELCEELHSYCDLPILFLTVVDDEETVVSTIDAHAEDYLSKPFRPRELVARAKRILRRVGRSTRLRSAVPMSRAAMCTAMPPTPVSRRSISPQWIPTRISTPSSRAASTSPNAHRSARVGASKIAITPSPANSTFWPCHRSTSARTSPW